MHALNKQTKSLQNHPEPYAVPEYNYLGICSQGAVLSVSVWITFSQINKWCVCDFLPLHENKVM